MTVDRTEFETLAALVAAGAASAEEVAALDRMIAEEPALAGEARSFADALGELSLSLEPVVPPPGALASIRAKVATLEGARSDDSAQAAGSVGADVISLASRRRKRTMALVMTSLAVAAAFALMWVRERSKADDLRGQLSAASSQHRRELDKAAELRREMTADLEAARHDVETVRAAFEPLRSASLELTTIQDPKGATVKIFVDPERRSWLVYAFSLPPAPTDKDYQLWFVPPEGKPVSAGLLRPSADGFLEATTELPEGLGQVRPAISLEVKGGVEQPTDVKLVGDLI